MAEQAGTFSPEKPTQPFLEASRVQSRRAALGLEDAALKSFVANSEFVGLGNHCVTSYGLQALDLKRRTYPFDWLRSPLSGVVQLLENNFEDFLTYTNIKPSTASAEELVYSTTRWGGSFWHHNVEDAKTAKDFQRRIERLLGHTDDVPATRRRVFIRALNSTRELDEVHRLLALLKQKLPSCEIRLLLLIDLQSSEELLRTATFGDSVLVHRIDGAIFNEDYQSWSMETCVENYARAMAKAVHYLAGSAVSGSVRTLADLKQVSAACEQFDGGDCGSETFWPRRFKGQRISISRRPTPALPALLQSEKLPKTVSDEQKPAPKVVQEHVQLADWIVPAGVAMGDSVHVAAFGRTLQVKVPDGVIPGACLRFRQAQGAVTLAVLMSATATATTASAVSTAAAASTLTRSATKSDVEVFRI